MNQKIFIGLILGLVLFIGITKAYNPPIYIANSTTLDCKYYFPGEPDCFNTCMLNCTTAYRECFIQCADVYSYDICFEECVKLNEENRAQYESCYEECADPCHFNPRPENYTINVGFKESDCNLWGNCTKTNGIWVKPESAEKNGTCNCQANKIWKPAEGCIEPESKEEKEMILCKNSGGGWWDNKCYCKSRSYWNPEKGCVEEKSYIIIEPRAYIFTFAIIAGLVAFLLWKSSKSEKEG